MSSSTHLKKETDPGSESSCFIGTGIGTAINTRMIAGASVHATSII
jgi:hypothetical protein